MRRDFMKGWIGVGLSAAAAMTLTACSETARTGRSPAFIIVDSLQAASGAEPDEFGTILSSDVQTLVDQTIGGQTVRVPTIFGDIGRATFRLALKDPGTPASPTAPSTLNSITLTRYRITFRRADGRNTPGVDVPYGFDGAFTITIAPGASVTAGFDMVRLQMKEEPPLRNLVNSGGRNLISTIAELTFYGQDQVGNEVEASATMTVNFGDFGDPQ